jgi:ureidoglycolate hydrolase
MKIEKYYHRGEGYNPFLIRNNWQVAQLNYVPTHGLDDITDVERHNCTDEVFILFKGTAVLVTAEFDDDETSFEYQKLERGVTYNVPAGVWHNIAMDEDAEIILVENRNTHLEDVDHRLLTKEQLSIVFKNIANQIGVEKSA